MGEGGGGPQHKHNNKTRNTTGTWDLDKRNQQQTARATFSINGLQRLWGPSLGAQLLPKVLLNNGGGATQAQQQNKKYDRNLEFRKTKPTKNRYGYIQQLLIYYIMYINIHVCVCTSISSWIWIWK